MADTFDTETQLNFSRYTSLADLLEHAFARHRGKTAFICLDKKTSFDDIERDSGHFAAYLQHHTELEPGDRIAIQLPNLTQFAIAAFGAIRAGMVLVNTNPLYTERELRHQFNDSGAKALVVLADLLPTVENVVPDTAISTVITTAAQDLIQPQETPDSTLATIAFGAVLAQGAKVEFTPVSVSSDTLALLQYTGGTTGLSKGAMLLHSNVLANTLQVNSRLGSRLQSGEEVFISPLPVYHIYAFLVNLILGFEIGACSVLIPNPRDIPGFVKTLAKYPFTAFAGINTLFVGLCHQVDFQALDFSRLKLTISGGTALTQAASSIWLETTGCTVSEGYGLSETSPVVCLNAPGLERLGTIGKPVLDTEIRILDAEDRDVEPGDAGQLAVRGPQVMAGYWQRPDATAEVMTDDGFFKTGDVAVAEDDDFYKIVDRMKDMIIVSGFNVYPNEVEDVLANHSTVMESAVISVKDEKSGEAVKAVIVLEDSAADHEAAAAELKAYCREQLTAYKVPRIFQFVEALPKSTVGKILRRELRDANN